MKTFVKTVQFNSKNISEDTDTYVEFFQVEAGHLTVFFILWNITNNNTFLSFLAHKFTISDYFYQEEGLA